jgi:hypothetical protein
MIWVIGRSDTGDTSSHGVWGKSIMTSGSCNSGAGLGIGMVGIRHGDHATD